MRDTKKKDKRITDSQRLSVQETLEGFAFAVGMTCGQTMGSSGLATKGFEPRLQAPRYGVYQVPFLRVDLLI